ncbi:hypothetical protein L6164_011690 [Bauhinia variegata]|uniref:Uncharacterized protein n=1 Tax=Bauhinia variegata TaxID=167791 RepID=A0ACB9P7W4_BAUVA|nr:hypothetical protein L6164_011690 [Bauhinia variegata]
MSESSIQTQDPVTPLLLPSLQTRSGRRRQSRNHHPSGEECSADHSADRYSTLRRTKKLHLCFCLTLNKMELLCLLTEHHHKNKCCSVLHAVTRSSSLMFATPSLPETKFQVRIA